MNRRILSQSSLHIQKQMQPRSVVLGYLLILLVSVFALSPALISGIPYSAHDALSHAKWQHFFSEQLWSGNLYPRWLSEMNDGYGSPVFFVYPPLPHFVTALSYPLWPDIEFAAYRLAWGAWIAFIAGGIGAFHWLRCITPSNKAACFGAVVYLLAPYHLYVDTYFRAAFAELWAFSWAPWTLLAIHMFKLEPRRASVIFTLSITGLLLSHAPSSLFLLPMYGIYAVHHAKASSNMKIVVMTLVGMFIGTAIAGAYLGTALTHTQYINTEALFNGYFDSSRWLLLDSSPWPEMRTQDVVTNVAALQTLVAIAFGIAALMLAKSKLPRHVILFPLIGCVITYLLMSKLSAPIWDIVTPLRKIQFPWRLLMLQTVFLAALSSLLIYKIEASDAGRGSFLLFVIPLITLLGFASVNARLFLIGKEVMPIIATEAHLGTKDQPEYVLGNTAELMDVFPDKTKVVLLQGDGLADIKEWSTRFVALQVEARSHLHIAIRQFNYTGWEYKIRDANSAGSAGTVGPEHRIVNFWVRPGQHVIELHLVPTTSERFGWLISALGVLLLSGWVLAQTHKNTARHSKRAN